MSSLLPFNTTTTSLGIDGAVCEYCGQRLAGEVDLISIPPLPDLRSRSCGAERCSFQLAADLYEHHYEQAKHDEVKLTELCEAACGHARVGKLDAADLALSEAIALAVVLGYDDSCHRVQYAARVVAHCRTGSPDPAERG